MKITSLIENTTNDPSLTREHGLSFFIETNGKKILFDSGQSGRFVDNAEKLGINLEDIDIAILSHGHYDHGGGMRRFLEKNKNAKLYMRPDAFKEHYHNKNKYIGLDPDLKESDRIIYVDDEYQISDGIRLSSCNNRDLKYPIDTSNLYVKENGEYKPENFTHEHYLEITEDGRKVLFSGCSHKGILNIMNWFSPDILIGGFHFMEIDLDEDGQEKLDKAAKELSEYNTAYYTCHCTGRKQYDFLKSRLGDKLNYLSTGESLEL